MTDSKNVLENEVKKFGVEQAADDFVTNLDALKVTDEGHAHLASNADRLRSGGDDSLSNLIQVLRGRISVMGQDCTTVTRLANVLVDQYCQTANMGDLLEAKSTMEAAMTLPELDEDFFEAAESLSIALIQNHPAAQDMSPPMEAIDFLRAVVEMMPSSNANYHRVVLQLGQLLFHLSVIENTEENFEEAASLFIRILDDSTLNAYPRVIVLMTLSANYVRSWERLHRGQDLDMALTYSTECVDLCPPSHSNWVDAQTNHATTLWGCSKRDDDGVRHQEAVEIMENLIQNHADKIHDGTRMNYALMLDRGYQRTGDLSLLERSIAILRPIVQSTSSANPMRGILCFNFGNCLQGYYDRTSDRQSVIDAHQYYVEALDNFPQGHPIRGQIIPCIETALEHMEKLNLPRNLSFFHLDQMGIEDAMCYLQRCRYLQGGTWLPKNLPGLVYAVKKATRDFQERGTLELLELLMELLEQTLSVCTTQDPRRLRLLRQKGDMQYTHFTRTNSLPSLHAAILAYEEFIERSPVEDEILLSCMSNLAQCLDERSQHGAKEDDLQVSIAMHRHVMKRALSGHPHHADAIISMTTTLDHMAERLHDIKAGEEAIRLYQYLLESCELSGGQRVLAKGHYGFALINRYQNMDELAALDEAITMLREVLILIKPDSASAKQQRATFLHNLGVAVHMRHERTGDMDSLDEAIKLYEELLNTLHPLDPMRSATLMALGNGYFDRGSQRQDMDEMTIARRNYESALSLCPRGHPSRSSVLHSLSRILQSLWSSQQDTELLIQAMEYAREGLELSPYANGYVYIYGLKGLAEKDVIFFHLTGDHSILDEAVQLLRQALDLLPLGQRLRGPVVLDLARTHWLRFLAVKNEEDLRESKRYVEEAMRLISKESRHMHECTELRFSQALQDGGVLGHRDILGGLRIGIESLNNEDFGIVRRVEFALDALKSVRPYAQNENERDLLTFYTTAIEYLPRSLAASEATPAARYQLLKKQSTGDIGRCAFMLALKLGVPKDALRLLETCRAAFWSQALWTRVQLDGLPTNISEELRSIFQSLEAPHESARRMSTGLPTVWEGGPAMEKRRRQRRRLEELATSIRNLPGHDRFMLTPTYEGLRKAARGTNIVILAHDVTGSAALVLRGDGHDVLHVPLPEVSEERLHMLARDVKDCYMQVRGGQDEDRLGLGVKNREKPKADVFAKLWSAVVQPVFHALDLKASSGVKRPRLHWCPTGLFSLLPLHAAGTYGSNVSDHGCSDYVVSSYTPSIGALLKAQKGSLATSKADARALLIDEAVSPGLPRLYAVGDEMKVIENILETNNVEYCRIAHVTDGATRDKVANRLLDATIIHFACHGQENSMEPLQSGFKLRDKTLTIQDLMKLDMPKATLAFLSACETAKGNQENPDFNVHLSAAMLFVGFKSIIGTLWSMHDDDGPFIAEAVYRDLCKGDVIDLREVPYALDAAVQELRNKGLPPRRWAPFIHMGA